MNIAIILAAGSSTRMGFDKLQKSILRKGEQHTVLEASHLAFRQHPEVDKVIIVDKEHGGETRMQSFINGLELAKKWMEKTLTPEKHAECIILDHNAASPFVTKKEITAVIAAAKTHGAAALSQPAVDTIIQEEDGFYSEVLDRDQVRHMQTPQAVRFDILNTMDFSSSVHTDLTTALLAQGQKVKVVQANTQNKKLTHPLDFPAETNYFVAEDSHRFNTDPNAEGCLVLGGLNIENHPAMEANSDGDVILHAIGRALAQATELSFSETADALHVKGEDDSQNYLKPLLKALNEKGMNIQNISIQIEGARPKIDPLKQQLQESVAKILSQEGQKLSPGQVTLSAMTGEDLSPFGAGEGLRVICICSIKS